MTPAKRSLLKSIISKLLAKLVYVKLRAPKLASGEVTEWLMVPLSKSGLRLYRSVGSNPTLSAERCWSGLTGTPGERVSGFPTVGSNPTLSASLRQGYGWQVTSAIMNPLAIEALREVGQPAPRLRLASQIYYVVRIYTEKCNRQQSLCRFNE